VRVPWTEAFAQDLRRFVEIELTKEVRLDAPARSVPFSSRPLGLPSGVKIAALTLERSPAANAGTSKESGHAFVEPQKPTFEVHLTNLEADRPAFELTLTLTPFEASRLSEATGNRGDGKVGLDDVRRRRTASSVITMYR